MSTIPPLSSASECVWCPDKQLFHVSQPKGKMIANGGYGIHLDGQEGVFLFIEECLVLYEQGILRVKTQNDDKMLESQELYEKLSVCGISLPVYLVYAHLRSQAYRVVRYSEKRRQLLEQMANGRSTDHLKKSLREVAATTQPPKCWFSDEECPKLAFDAYLPNSNFKKSDPGLPDLCVVCMAYSQPSPQFSEIQNLLKQAHPSPLKIATVSDGGTVVMFALTDFGVPTIPKRETKE